MKASFLALFVGIGCAGPAPVYVDIAVGRGHACALDEDGEIGCFGKHAYNEVHHPPEGTFSALSGASQQSCALDVDGKIQCWGYTYEPPSGPYAQIASGGNVSCALDEDGEGTCWGDSGNLGTQIPERRFQEIALGEQHGCGLREDGGVECWGQNNYAQTDAPEGVFTHVSAAYAHSCALDVDGGVHCWGRGAWLRDLPTDVDDAVDLISGGTFACILNEEHKIWCWGDIFRWSWGDDTPTREEPAGPYVAADADHARMCAARMDGDFDCFGSALWHQ